MRFLRGFMKTGTILFVSHDTGAVVNLCSEAILLNRGQVMATGSPKNVIERYLATLYEAEQIVDGVARDSSATPAEQSAVPLNRDMRKDMIRASNKSEERREGKEGVST